MCQLNAAKSPLRTAQVTAVNLVGGGTFVAPFMPRKPPSRWLVAADLDFVGAAIINTATGVGSYRFIRSLVTAYPRNWSFPGRTLKNPTHQRYQEMKSSIFRTPVLVTRHAANCSHGGRRGGSVSPAGCRSRVTRISHRELSGSSPRGCSGQTNVTCPDCGQSNPS
jgi:hypothetical protein